MPAAAAAAGSAPCAKQSSLSQMQQEHWVDRHNPGLKDLRAGRYRKIGGSGQTKPMRWSRYMLKLAHMVLSRYQASQVLQQPDVPSQ